MQLAIISFLALALSQGISAAPADAATANVVSRDRDLEKRDVQGTVTDVVLSRACPREELSCAPGRLYVANGVVTVECYTGEKTTPVDDNPLWLQLSDRYWVPLARVSLGDGPLGQCPPQ